MDDAALVGVLDGVADGREEREAFGGGHRGGRLGERAPCDEFHREVRARVPVLVGLDPGFEDLRDVGVVEAPEGLGLVLEAPAHGF